MITAKKPKDYYKEYYKYYKKYQKKYHNRNKKLYKAYVRIRNKRILIGRYKTPRESINATKAAMWLIKEVKKLTKEIKKC